MRFQHLTPADYRVMPWANGRGTTVELVRIDDEAGGLKLRLSVADVVEAGAFSRFPGIDRVLTLIEGDGFDLDFGGAAPGVSARPFAPVAFSGDGETSALNLRGPSRDFNVMTARDSYDVHVVLLPQGPSMWPANPGRPRTGSGGMSCLYVASGSAVLGALGLYLQTRALLLVEGSDAIDVDASGEVLALRLDPRR
jgi:environmental stress-induced protein Ves